MGPSQVAISGIVEHELEASHCNAFSPLFLAAADGGVAICYSFWSSGCRSGSTEHCGDVTGHFGPMSGLSVPAVWQSIGVGAWGAANDVP